jgi:hypothetical protein
MTSSYSNNASCMEEVEPQCKIVRWAMSVHRNILENSTVPCDS